MTRRGFANHKPRENKLKTPKQHQNTRNTKTKAPKQKKENHVDLKDLPLPSVYSPPFIPSPSRGLISPAGSGAPTRCSMALAVGWWVESSWGPRGRGRSFWFFLAFGAVDTHGISWYLGWFTFSSHIAIVLDLLLACYLTVLFFEAFWLRCVWYSLNETCERWEGKVWCFQDVLWVSQWRFLRFSGSSQEATQKAFSYVNIKYYNSSSHVKSKVILVSTRFQQTCSALLVSCQLSLWWFHVSSNVVEMWM